MVARGKDQRIFSREFREAGYFDFFNAAGVGNVLKYLALNPASPYRLASGEEALAIKPELRPLE
jgi:hypothetical protein